MSQRVTSIDSLLNQVAYENRKSVKDSLTSVYRNYDNLYANIGKLIRNNGSESQLIVLSGTIPTVFRGVEYHTPIEVYLEKTFPKATPIVYCRPTNEMVVQMNHPHVQPDGLVMTPYLLSWTYNSNLNDLLRGLSAIFGQQPPLLQRPKGSVGIVKSSSVSQYSSGINHQQYNSPSPMLQNTILQNNKYNSTPNIQSSFPNSQNPYQQQSNIQPYPSSNAQSQYQQQSNNQPSYTSGNSNSKKDQLIQEVTLALQQELHKYYCSTRDELDQEFQRESKLNLSSENVKLDIKKLKRLREEYHNLKQNITEKQSLVDSWSNNDEMNANNSALNMVVPYDDLTEQFIKLTAEYRTIEDAFYYLNKALVSDDSKIDVNLFIKEARKLARQQFICKAHLMRIQALVK